MPNTRNEWIFAMWTTVIVLLWGCGLVAPFIFLEPAGFWQKLIFVGVEFVWACVITLVGVAILIGVSKSLED